MAGKTAVDGNADEALLDAEVFIAVRAVAALAAADPGEYRLLLSDQVLWSIWTDLLDDARDLMSQRERQRHAACGVEPLAAAKIGVSVLDMQV